MYNIFRLSMIPVISFSIVFVLVFSYPTYFDGSLVAIFDALAPTQGTVCWFCLTSRWVLQDKQIATNDVGYMEFI